MPEKAAYLAGTFLSGGVTIPDESSWAEPLPGGGGGGGGAACTGGGVSFDVDWQAARAARRASVRSRLICSSPGEVLGTVYFLPLAATLPSHCPFRGKK